MKNVKTVLYAKNVINQISNVESNVVTNKGILYKAIDRIIKILSNKDKLDKRSLYLRRDLLKTWKHNPIIKVAKNKAFLNKYLKPSAFKHLTYMYCDNLSYDMPYIHRVTVANFVHSVEYLKLIISAYLNHNQELLKQHQQMMRMTISSPL